LSIYNDLKDNIDNNGYLSYKFDISKYSKVNASYNLGGADAFYIFSNNFDNEYREDKFIINLFEKFKDNYDIKDFCSKLEEYINNREDFLLIYNIDFINEYFINNKKDIKPEFVYKLSRYIIAETDNVEVLKLGIYLLCQFDLGKIDKKIILDLALCDEFTFYSLFYGIIKFQDSNELIFDLIKKVYGIGRLFLIDQLVVDSTEKREYLVLNTNFESIGNIGIGRVIGTKINILNYLSLEVSDDIYIGLSNVVNSIIFSEYERFNKYEEMFLKYIDVFNNYRDISIGYYVITNIYNYVMDETIKNKVYDLISNKKFIKNMINIISDTEDTNLLYEITYLLCNIESFGLEKYIYKRFITDSYRLSFMMDLLINSDKYREDALKVFYDNFRFCDGDLTNTYNEYSIYSLKNKYVLNLIENYPFVNNDFIIKSLFSKYYDVRNTAMNTLYTWNRESDIDIIDTPIYDKLIELKEKETSVEIKRSICNLLDIDEKFRGKDKIVCDNNIDYDFKSIYDLDENLISFNDRKKIVFACIKNDDLYTCYLIGDTNKMYRIDVNIDEKGNINSIKSDDNKRDIDKVFVLYYLKNEYYR